MYKKEAAETLPLIILRGVYNEKEKHRHKEQGTIRAI